jgi:hypothetical protein
VLKALQDGYTKARIGPILRSTLIALLVSIACVIYWTFVLLFRDPRYLSPLQSLLNLAWDAYDVAMARSANTHIVVLNPQYRPGKSFQNNGNPDHDWGFRQILPFVMLLQPILAAFDI